MTNVAPFRHSRLDKEEAGQWLARIDRGLSQAEHEVLKLWLRDPQRRETLFGLAQHWDNMSVVAELAELFPLRETEGSGWHSIGRAAAVAMVAVALGGLAVYWHSRTAPALSARVGVETHNAHQPIFRAQYSTPIGGRRSIELPDRSRVQLNTNTELQVAFSDNARLLTMSRGEAMFEVAKDPSRVFTVRVAGYEFKAVGTAFNIRADSPSEVQLTVTEGRVRVHHGAAADTAKDPASGAAPTVFEDPSDVEVEANKAVSIAARSERIDILTPDQVAEATSWQRGVIVFKATPLGQVVNELARYSTQRFVIAKPELANIPVSGYFEVGDVESLSTALQQNVGVKITQENGYLLLSSAPQNQ
jgi:transmembrane sensor